MESTKISRQRETQGSSSVERCFSQARSHLSPWGVFHHQFYEETLWSGTVSWHTVEPPQRILILSARRVIIWMGKPLKKFPLVLQVWLILDISRRSILFQTQFLEIVGHSSVTDENSPHKNQTSMFWQLINKSKLPVSRRLGGDGLLKDG